MTSSSALRCSLEAAHTDPGTRARRRPSVRKRRRRRVTVDASTKDHPAPVALAASLIP
jgi:hypothetical protein